MKDALSWKAKFKFAKKHQEEDQLGIIKNTTSKRRPRFSLTDELTIKQSQSIPQSVIMDWKITSENMIDMQPKRQE